MNLVIEKLYIKGSNYFFLIFIYQALEDDVFE